MALVGDCSWDAQYPSVIWDNQQEIWDAYCCGVIWGGVSPLVNGWTGDAPLATTWVPDQPPSNIWTPDTPVTPCL